MKPLIAAALALCALMPAAAAASMSQESVFEDDNVLLQRGASRQASGLTEMAALGADTIRSLAFWRDFVPGPRAAKRPAGFKPASVKSYPAALWDRYDDLVRGAHARGMEVLLTPTSPVPRWASHCKGGATAVRNCKPDPKLYEGFVRALGTRYSGSYADENQGGGVLPRVDHWSLFNEPNQPGWLRPQLARHGSRLVDDGARLYRSLAAAGVRGLRATGHGADRILLGETAPIGRTAGPVAKRPAPPVTFLRTLLCVDAHGHKLRGAARRLAGCTRIRRLHVNGFAHHPYTQGGHDAPFAKPSPGQISFTSVARLKRLLTQGARAGVIPARLPIFYTEFGYQTNPPDPRLGVAPKRQAQYLNQADYIAARDPRIRSVSQYKLVDDQDQAAFQTGLRRYGSLVKKPAYTAYQLPIWVVRAGSRIRVYGQVRTAAAGSRQRVEIQYSPPSGEGFRKVATATVSSRTGQFLTTVAARSGGLWRLVWTPAGSGTLFSREAVAGTR